MPAGSHTPLCGREHAPIMRVFNRLPPTTCMSIYELKPKFQQLLRPLVRRLYARGVTANQVTLFACLISVCFGIGFALAPHCARAFR